MERIERIINAVKAVRNGAMCRVQYKSDMPVKAGFKKLGVSITKITESTVRFGVAYEHIGTVIERKSAEDYVPANREYDREWLVDNKVFHNNKNGNDYLRFANVNNHANKRPMFLIKTTDGETTTDALTDEQKHFVIDSYWSKTFAPEVQDIRIDNVLRIGKECFE